MIDALNGPRFAARPYWLRVSSLSLAVAICASSGGLAQSTRGTVDPQLKADEQEMLDKARREAPAKGPMVNIGAPIAGTTDPSALEKARQAELQRLSEKLRHASRQRPANAPAPVTSPWQTEVTEAPKGSYAPTQRSALGFTGSASVQPETRVTILMAMEPGARGIRRFDKTADPILCMTEGCYISNGPATAARYLTIPKSLGLSNTLGPRAGACAHSTICVFRGIELGDSSAYVQPVDMRVINHDRREVKRIEADTTCRLESGRLACGRPVRGDDYTLWIVPESMATLAGAEALHAAVQDGLTSRRADALSVPRAR